MVARAAPAGAARPRTAAGVPSASMRPASRIATRSQYSASSMKCVVTTTVTRCCASWVIRCQNSRRANGSAPLGEAVLDYLIETAVIIAFSILAFRLTRVRKLVAQYPWLYERSGPFSWKEKMPQVQSGK